MPSAGPVIETRLKHLETHLEKENPVLLTTVRSFRELDAVAYKMGLFDPEESYTTQIPWWPLISILGTFSAGKSTFINYYLGEKLQRSGNQAVDDKFTVLCFSDHSSNQALPGVALDADPRFPFYKISAEIEKVASGEGSRIDAYLQLKTTSSEALRGKILIDSPGFDADAQRTSTLRITDHIIDLSDLVLVFFDARHPEPGAMRDTLDHLVSKTINRADSGKFLYILNQLDTTAREDNPEEVVAAWQRALGERGLTAGRFFTIYNDEAANPINDPALRARFESKRDNDMAEIRNRMEQVEIERAYRIVASLEKTARGFEEKTVPALTDLISAWRKRTLVTDGFLAAAIVVLFLWYSISNGQWQGMSLQADWWKAVSATPMNLYWGIFGAFVVWLLLHFGVRHLTAKSLYGQAQRLGEKLGLRGNLARAFLFNTRFWRSIFAKKPSGWSGYNRRQVERVYESTDRYIQDLNDRFTDPSGRPPAELSAPLDTKPAQQQATETAAAGASS
jgi:hypothetical protein